MRSVLAAVFGLAAIVACSSESATGGSSPSPSTSSTSQVPQPGVDGGTTRTDGGTVVPEAGPPSKPSSSSMKVSGTQPSTGDGTMTIESIEAQNAGGQQSDRIKVTVYGSTGGKKHKIMIYFFADNGQMSSVTHQWADDLSDVFQADGVAYCDALGVDQPVCQGLYHDFQQRFIVLTNTHLAGKFPGNTPTASNLDGAILYPAY